MYILGISCFYHDSAACLIKDGKLIAAAEEERFTRKKHDNSFPFKAIRYCLSEAGISINEVDHVAYYEKPLLKFERLLYQHVHCFPWTLKTFLSSMPSWFTEKLRVPKFIRKKLKFKGDIYFIDHHMSHAASSFLVSPFNEAAILTADGVGEWSTTTLGYGKGSQITLTDEIKFPHSLGLLYSTVTAYLGFSVNNSEYKVMGLSPYGVMDREKNPYYEKLRQVIDIKADGSYRLDMSYFSYHYSSRMPSTKLCELLGGPISARDSEMTQRHKDIAAALQMILEDLMVLMLTHLHQKTGLKNVVLAGGCALNSVSNGKLLQSTPFENIWIQPNATDGGSCIGAAYYLYNSILKKPRNFVQESPYLGPSFSDQQIRDYFIRENIHFEELSSTDELLERTASLLADNKVIGWFQGRMEWGPRALGARSILANPSNPQAKELLNSKVKHREKFRPFAPVVCKDDAPLYFSCDTPIPIPTDYMLMVYPIKKEWQNKLPSVSHVDGSGRLQTVDREMNPLYYDLLKKFGKRSGVPVLINTSFNIRGEPIVCTPFDAYRCMMGTGIDYLVISSFIVSREKNPQDQWDSEKYAKD